MLAVFCVILCLVDLSARAVCPAGGQVLPAWPPATGRTRTCPIDPSIMQARTSRRSAGAYLSRQPFIRSGDLRALRSRGSQERHASSMLEPTHARRDRPANGDYAPEARGVGGSAPRSQARVRSVVPSAPTTRALQRKKAAES